MAGDWASSFRGHLKVSRKYEAKELALHPMLLQLTAVKCHNNEKYVQSNARNAIWVPNSRAIKMGD